MPHSAAEPAARFSAYAPEQDPAHSHMMPEAQSFADAAIYFAEIWHPSLDEIGQVKVMVIDQLSGEHRCFCVDVGAGEAEACDEPPKPG